MNEADLSILTIPPRLWNLSRGDGTLISPRLRLTGTGAITGVASFHEASWCLTDHLVFRDRNGNATTRFTKVERAPDSLMTLSGVFLADSSVTHVLKEIPPRRTSGSKVALLVRAHNSTDKLFAFLELLSEGEGYDVFLAADETRRTLDAGGFRKVTHSEEMCRDLGLMPSAPMRSLLWYFGDYAFYCFGSAQPGYDHYLMIEYDVALARQSPLAVEMLVQRLASAMPTIDLVAPYLSPRDESWMWSAQCARRFPNVFGLFFPLVSLSRAALDMLFDLRREEAASRERFGDPIFCESFVPSALQAAKRFRCLDLNVLLPRAYEHESFRGGVPMIETRLPARASRCEFLHPVFSLDEYVARLLDGARDPGRRDEFYALLDGLYRDGSADNGVGTGQIARLGELHRGHA